MTDQPGTAADSQDTPKADAFLLSQDLMFISKVTSTGAALGLRILTIGTMGLLQSQLKSDRPRAVFLDLACPEFEPPDVLTRLTYEPRPVVIAFGSHVDTARLELAVGAGCNEALPRSKFSSTLPDLLRRTLRRD